MILRLWPRLTLVANSTMHPFAFTVMVLLFSSNGLSPTVPQSTTDMTIRTRCVRRGSAYVLPSASRDGSFSFDIQFSDILRTTPRNSPFSKRVVPLFPFWQPSSADELGLACRSAQKI